MPYAEFKAQYAGNGMIELVCPNTALKRSPKSSSRNSLHFFASLDDNPDDQIFVYFADEASIGIKTMRKFVQFALLELPADETT